MKREGKAVKDIMKEVGVSGATVSKYSGKPRSKTTTKKKSATGIKSNDNNKTIILAITQTILMDINDTKKLAMVKTIIG